MRLIRTMSIVSTAIVAFCCASCGVDESTLTKIAVTKEPDKIVYNVGEKFDPTGMEVTGYYAEDKTALIKDYIYTPTSTLTTAGSKTITISYKNFTCTTKISVRNAPDPGDYYASITDDMRGSELKNALQAIIKKNIQVSYDWKRYEKADEDLNNANNITTIYARTSMKKNDHVSGDTGWNREHSIPQSKITGDPEKDNHLIFASDNKVNNQRSNYRLAQLSISPNVKDCHGKLTPCKLGSKGGETFFDPGDTIARGMVARATMYGYVLYGLSPTLNFESVTTMMNWHNEYPPEEVDIARNQTVFENQRNRNPFVDHPEYAERIWG